MGGQAAPGNPPPPPPVGAASPPNNPPPTAPATTTSKIMALLRTLGVPAAIGAGGYYIGRAGAPQQQQAAPVAAPNPFDRLPGESILAWQARVSQGWQNTYSPSPNSVYGMRR
jgi:hypothetical protein